MIQATRAPLAASLLGPLAALTLLTACPSPPPSAVPETSRDVVLSIVGTADVHGALPRLPMFGGYLANLRAARAADGGVVLIDGGDMFQGTLESNLNEGAAMIAAFAALGYHAAAIGNHEFDFGPLGPKPVPEADGDDPRGALKARIAESPFPLLTANVVRADDHHRVDWGANAPASVIREVAGVKVGVIGVTTEETAQTTMPANFAGLATAALTPTITREAQALRERGAQVVLVAAHAGGRCASFDNPDDASVCANDGEIMAVARALPAGLVDVIVAGHTHQAMAHRVGGTVVVQGWSRMSAFSRVDLVVSAKTGQVTVQKIYPPHPLCPGPEQPAPIETCAPGDYEGRPVVPDPAIERVIAAPLATAQAKRETRLGVDLATPITRNYRAESSMGNLFTDLMRQARPADVSMTNAGGLRADLPAGPLTYGALHEAFPFDNRFAIVRITGAQLRAIIARNLGSDHGFLSFSGIRARARCEGGALRVDVAREDGAPIADDAPLTLLTSDFLATGGEGLFATVGIGQDAVELTGGNIRDAMADVLRQRGGTVSSASLVDPARPRIAYPGLRPVRCTP